MKALFQFVVVVTVLLASSAGARPGVLLGTVVDAETKKPVDDVVVTATSPSIQGEQTVVTDVDGQYRIPQLPPGIYALRFEKEGRRPFSRGDIPLREGRTLRVNVELVRSELLEEFEIITDEPSIPWGSSSLSTYFEDPFLLRIAANRPAGTAGAVRSLDGIAELAPGAQRDAYGVSINGATAFENAYLVDGLSTTDPVYGVNALPLHPEFTFIHDTLTGGLLPEYGRASGGTIEAVTPWGSNQFSGSVFGTWTPGALEGARAPGEGTLKNLGDFGATLGGPLIQNRLWFFAGLAPALSRVEQASGSRPAFADQRGYQAIGKLRYLLDWSQSLSLMVLAAPMYSGGEGRLTVDRLTGSVPSLTPDSAESVEPRELDTHATLTAFSYGGAFLDHKLRLDVNGGWLRERVSRVSVRGGAESLSTAERYQANAKVTHFFKRLGDHALKAGVDAEFLSFDAPRDTVASLPTSTLLGGFVQDSIPFLNLFMLNAGLRYDVQSLDVGNGARRVVLGSPLSPRVGLAVGPLAGGQLFAHFAKYQAPVPLAFSLAPGRFSGGGQGPEVVVDPGLVSQVTSEWVAGADFHFPWLSYARVRAVYTRRRLDSALAYVPRPDGSFLLGNPGQGLAGELARPERSYDAVTVLLSRHFIHGWSTELSYTWSLLRGNYPGFLQAPAGQGEPGVFTASESSALAGRESLLPLDRTHSIKAFAVRTFSLTKKLEASLGLSYRAASGAPVDGTAERTPWVHEVDPHLGVEYWLGAERGALFSLDVFNLFNAQAATGALQYQSPRQVRLGARYLF